MLEVKVRQFVTWLRFVKNGFVLGVKPGNFGSGGYVRGSFWTG